MSAGSPLSSAITRMPFGSPSVSKGIRGKSPRNSMILINKDNELNFAPGRVGSVNISRVSMSSGESSDNSSRSCSNSNSNSNNDDNNGNGGRSGSSIDANNPIEEDSKIFASRDSLVFQIDHTALSEKIPQKPNTENKNILFIEPKNEEKIIDNNEVGRSRNSPISLPTINPEETDDSYLENETDWTEDDYASLSVSVRTGDIPLKGDEGGNNNESNEDDEINEEEEDGDEDEEEEEEEEEDEEEESGEEEGISLQLEDENSRRIHK